MPCATCGAEPSSVYSDGSPRYRCSHAPIYPGMPVHPSYTGPQARLVVELDDAEMAEALACGKSRLTKAKRRKLKDYLGLDSLDSHVMGAQGERAFTKWLGDPWKCSLDGFGGAADVRGVQVRTVPRTSDRLKVRKDDPDRRPCVLVVAHPPRFLMAGWIFAGEARRVGVIDDPGDRGRPATFVLPSQLRPLPELLKEPKARAAMGLPPEGA